MAESYTLSFQFHGDLPRFLPRPGGAGGLCRKSLGKRTSVKDAIEACGVPHTEVDLVHINGAPADFSVVLGEDAQIEVFGVPSPAEFSAFQLQERGIRCFVADGHLGKLTRDLRLLGIDVVNDHTATDPDLLAIAIAADRALLTRDRRLLMHRIVRHGYYVRSQNPEEQTLEVIKRFDLAKSITPYTRCLRCNGILTRVEKQEVLDQLEPLTRLYYQDFRRCTECGRVYWPGSHFAKLQERIERLRMGTKS